MMVILNKNCGTRLSCTSSHIVNPFSFLLLLEKFYCTLVADHWVRLVVCSEHSFSKHEWHQNIM